MSRYLEEAADLLRKSAAATDRCYGSKASGNGERDRIARGFATLAAIDKGLLPAEITQDVIAALVSRPTV